MYHAFFKFENEDKTSRAKWHSYLSIELNKEKFLSFVLMILKYVTQKNIAY